MVKLFALCVFYKGQNEGRLLKAAYDLQSFSFFQRGAVQEFMGYVVTNVYALMQYDSYFNNVLYSSFLLFFF